MKRNIDVNDLPTVEALENELRREKYRRRYTKLLRSTIYALVIVAAVSVLVATLLLPVLQIYGTSMTPGLDEGDIVVSVKGGELSTGDIVAFYYNNRILVKRVIALPGQRVNIDDDGNVYIDNVMLDEPYLAGKAAGQSDIAYPFTVPENTYFVLGDHRETSVDSRNSIIGCISPDEIVGKIVFRVWPLKDFGKVK